MTGTAADAIRVANTFLGIHENPDGSNRTVLGERFGWNGVPWCAISVSLILSDPAVGLKVHTASTDEMEAWGKAKTHSLELVSGGRTAKARPGDIAVWDFKGDGTPNHVSMVEKVLADGRIQTLGGNEQNEFRRAIRSRTTALRGFVRPAYTVAAPAPAPAPAPTRLAVDVKLPLLREGSRGKHVQTLRFLLRVKAGQTAVSAGDRFDPTTTLAVNNVKRFFGLKADGIVGEAVWKILLEIPI